VPTLRWQPIASLVLSVYGLGASIYLTITHFEPKALACVSNSTFNCEKVTQSPQSEIFGIPVAMLGLAFFVPMLVLCLPVAWRAADRRIHLARLAMVVVGMGMVLYLISAELFAIKAICLWCSSVHAATFLLFIIVATASPTVLAEGYGTTDDDRIDADEIDEVPVGGDQP